MIVAWRARRRLRPLVVRPRSREALDRLGLIVGVIGFPSDKVVKMIEGAYGNGPAPWVTNATYPAIVTPEDIQRLIDNPPPNPYR